MAPHEIHVTERSTFKFCRRQWKYAYKECLVPIVEPYNALWIGRGLHYGLAAYYRGIRDGKVVDPVAAFDEWLKLIVPDADYQQLWDEDRRRIQEFRDLAKAVLSGYVDHSKRYDDFEIVAVEQPIRARIPGTRSYLIGTLDLLVRRNNSLWVVDHKNVTSFTDPEYLDWDDQMTSYLWLVWQQYKEFPSGAIYNQLRKKIPAEPYRLKNGAMSKDKSIDTTPRIYREALLKAGLDPKDYEDILMKLEMNEFYRRELIARNPRALEAFSKDLADEARIMRDKHAPTFPSPSKDCIWACSYKILSRAESDGGDVEALKEAHYKAQKERGL